MKMQLLKKIISVKLLVAIACSLSFAQANEWIQEDLYGADVVDVAIGSSEEGTLVAAATKPYIRTATDETWQVLANLYEQAPNGITSVEASPSGLFFAGGAFELGRVFKSSDGGLSWQEKSLGIDNGVLNIVIDPVDENIVYLTTTSNNSSDTNLIVFKSIDSGESWTPIDMTSALPVGLQCTDLAIDPNDNQFLVALGDGNFSFDAKVALSTDGGDSWQEITSSLAVNRPLNDVEVRNGSIFVVGGHHFSGDFGIYKSDDAGVTWDEISLDFPIKKVNDLAISPLNHDLMFAATEGGGIYTTTDGGISWDFNSQATAFNGACRQIVFDANDANDIYAAYIGIGVLKSNDMANNWMLYSQGMKEVYLNDVAVAPNDSGLALAAYEGVNSGGCFVYKPDEDEWQPVRTLPACRYSRVAIGADGAMYAWSRGPTGIAQDGLYKSIDNGDTWENMGPNPGPYLDTEINAIAISSTNPNLIFIAGNNFGTSWEAVMYRSVNGGESWETVALNSDYNSFRAIHIDPQSDDIIYAAYNSGSPVGGFLKSVDGGNSWNTINNGIASTAKWGSCIAVAPTNSDVLYGGVGGSSGIARTLYKSVDAGATWVNTFLPVGENFSKVTDILIAPSNSDVVYVSTNKDGVYFTQDGGNTWETANDGLTASDISAFSTVYEDEGMSFYAASYGNGMFKQELDVAVGVNDLKEDAFFTLYPNPAREHTTIQVEATMDCSELNIYTISGHLLYKKSCDESRSQLITTNALPKGLYIVELVSTNNRVFRQKLVVSN